MPPRKRTPAADGDRSGHEGRRRRGDDQPRLGHNPDADPVRLHREYVQRRLSGGALPTPERFERALDQWHRLPGAVRGPAAELHPGEEPATAEGRRDRQGSEQETYEGPLPATDPGDNRAYERRSR